VQEQAPVAVQLPWPLQVLEARQLNKEQKIGNQVEADKAASKTH
jgi:hypothetical protein